MTTRVTFTVAALCKAITAVEKKGYRVAGIKPDGTVLVYSGDERPESLSIAPGHEEPKKGVPWRA